MLLNLYNWDYLRNVHMFYVIVADELLGEKEKYKGISEELDTTFAELAGF